MYYQTQLLPLDDEGRFLLARHFARFQVGGEDTRETAFVRFAVGHVDQLGRANGAPMQDVTALFTRPRPASAAEAGLHRQMAAGQGELARSGQYGKAASAHYANNEVAMNHAALLADSDTVWVPRRVAASRTGRVLMSLELRDADHVGPPPALLRWVDALAGTVEQELSSSRMRFAEFHALAVDGCSLLGFAAQMPPLKIAECRLQDGLPEAALLPGAWNQQFIAVRGGWICVSESVARHIEGGSGRVVCELTLTPGAWRWGATASLDGTLLGLAGERGAVRLMGLDDGRQRLFHPHRGVRAGTPLALAISDCKGWLASRAGDDLVITRLPDGLSWPVARLADAVHEEQSAGGYVIRSQLPAAFAFVGSRLVIFDQGEPREIVLGEPPAGCRPIVSEQGRPGARKPIKLPAHAPIDRLLKAARLQAAADHILPHHSPALTIKTKALNQAGWWLPPKARAPGLGSSRFGGWPDLPEGQDWPMWQGRPMAFLGQINLAEAHAVQPQLRLPAQGLLAFFVGCLPDTYQPEGDHRPRYLLDVMIGSEPAQRDGWRVLHFAGDTPLQRRSFEALPLPQLFEPCALRLAKGGKPLPDDATVAYGLLRLDDDQRDDYNDAIHQRTTGDAPVQDQLMGHPQLIQGTPPELMCELASRGRDPFSVRSPADPQHDEVLAAASRWGLLLQLTSNPDAGFGWGDGGHFYFYGRREAMAAGDFSGVWVVFEN